MPSSASLSGNSEDISFEQHSLQYSFQQAQPRPNLQPQLQPNTAYHKTNHHINMGSMYAHLVFTVKKRGKPMKLCIYVAGDNKIPWYNCDTYYPDAITGQVLCSREWMPIGCTIDELGRVSDPARFRTICSDQKVTPVPQHQPVQQDTFNAWVTALLANFDQHQNQNSGPLWMRYTQ